MFKKFCGINSLVFPVDKTKCRELLPEQFDLPESPQASAFVAHYQIVYPWPTTSYLEGAVFLKCIFDGREYWYTYTMPVTKYVPMWVGRSMGFPKYVADKITLDRAGESWEGRVTHQQKTQLFLRFTPGLKAKPSSLEKFATEQRQFFFGNGITLAPP
jgi:hypothetical protein